MEVLFGAWARLSRFRVLSLEVEPLANAREILVGLKAGPGYSRGWIYPPLTRPPFDDRPVAPRIPAKAYALPPTHKLVLGPPLGGEDLADFVIALIGFIDGVRLIRDGWTHFYKAPLDLHALSDVYPDLREIAEIVRIATEFWLASSDYIRSRVFGAIHWLQFGLLLEHDFERFAGLYSVLDTLYRVHVERTGVAAPTHALRPALLAEHYQLPTPSWAVVSTSGHAPLTDLRNELIHEARYAGAPTGFAYPKDHPEISMELGHFVSRLLLAVLQVPAGYVRTSATTRHMHALDMMGPFQAT